MERPSGGERADARRNRELLLDAAAVCVADKGADVAALDIAERAGVSVATLYRRFTTKEALIEQILTNLLTGLLEVAHTALLAPDPWAGLTGFVRAFAQMNKDNHGLAQALGPQEPSSQLADLQRMLRTSIHRLTNRAQLAGVIRPDVTWQDIAFLPKTSLVGQHCIGLRGSDQQWERCLTITLDGLRPQAPTDLPGKPGWVPRRPGAAQ